MKELKTIWTVQWDWTFDGNEHASDFEVFASKQDAQNFFDKMVLVDKTENYGGTNQMY